VPDAIDVLFPLPLGPLTYLAPLHSGAGEAVVGRRVVVPWQAGVRVGLVARSRQVDAGRGLELKHALRYLDESPYLGQAQLRALDSIARGTGLPQGLVLATLGVPGVNPELTHEVMLHASPAAEELFGDLPVGEWFPAERVDARELEHLRAQGLVDEAVRVVRPTRRVLVPLRRADDDLAGQRQANQRAALVRLLELGEAESAAALARDAEVPEGAVRALVEKGYAGYVEAEAPVPPLPAPPLRDDRLEDPPPGAAAPDKGGYVAGGSRRSRLSALLPVLEADLEAGRSVIVVAPEITLAREAAGLLATRLPVTYLTGEATDDQREALFAALPAGGPVVLVGSHVALLAPVPELGRVVVLEAGNQAYKLRSGGRLYVPKVAQRLAAAAGASLTLTDVVPSPELSVLGAEGGGRLLPLPKLSLVAVTLFDVHLALADFRAEHEALRMLFQLAELTSERRPLVLVQTYAPGAPSLRAAASETPDVAVEALLAAQLERRRRFGYPPFTTLAKVQVAARDSSTAHAGAHAAADRLRVAGAREDELLGPEAAPVARVRGQYTFQLLLRVADEARLETLLAALPDRLSGAKVTVDVDPVDVGELLE
jgi:primosomal protein N'